MGLGATVIGTLILAGVAAILWHTGKRVLALIQAAVVMLLATFLGLVLSRGPMPDAFVGSVVGVLFLSGVGLLYAFRRERKAGK